MNDDEVRKVIMDLAEELKNLYVDMETEELCSYEDALSDISTEFALELFKVFSIIDVSLKEFSKWKDVSPFYNNVAKEGVILYTV